MIRAIGTSEHPRMMWRLMAATAMMLVLVIGTYGATLHRQHQRMRAMRAETQQIATELERVKEKADAAEPIVVLENGDTRVIVANQESTPIYY